MSHQGVSGKWRCVWLALAAIAWSLMPEMAMAATATFPFAPVGGDKSVEMLLKPIFGDLFGGAAVGGLTQVITIMNTAAITIGGFLAAYTLIFGTMQTAHDGEMLGKKWSSMWLPIRTVLGIGLVVPTSTGWCTAQMLVAWLALQGVGLADALWGAYVAGFATTSSMAPKVAMPQTREFAKGVLESLVCIEAGNSLNSANPGIATSTYSAGNQSGGKGRLYGNSDHSSMCGAVNYAAIKPPVIDGATSSILNLASTPAERTAASDAIRQAHIDATIALEGALRPLAKAVVAAADGNASATTIDVSILDKAADQYQADVAAKAGGVFGGTNALDAIKTSSTSDGWILAGAWFMRGAQLQDLINKAASSTPASTPPMNTFAAVGLTTSMATASYADSNFVKYYTKLEGALGRSTGQFGIAERGSSGQSSNDMDKWGKKVFGSFVEDISKSIALDPNRHPVMALKDLGDTLMWASEGALLVGGGLMAKAGVLTVGTTNGAIMYFGILLLMLFGPILAFASMAAVYFPVLPFIIFFGTALGWLVLVGEAVIAVPLAAIMKLTPAGDDIMGGAKQAYMLLLGLALRPALTIMGFIVSLIGVEYFLRLFNQVFFPVFFSAIGASVAGIVTLAVGLGIYFGTLTYLLHKAFGLCHVLPDQILRWLGGGGGEVMGQWGGSAGDAGKGHTTAIVGNISNRTASVSDSFGRNMSNQQSNRIAKGNEERQESIGAAKEVGKTPELQAAAAESSADANAPGASTGSMVQAVANRAALASHLGATSGALGKANQSEKASQYAASAQRETSAANNMVGKIEKRAEASEETARSSEPDSAEQASAYRQTETDFKGARDAHNIMGNSEAAASFNTRSDAAGMAAERIERTLSKASTAGTPPEASTTSASPKDGSTTSPEAEQSTKAPPEKHPPPEETA